MSADIFYFSGTGNSLYIAKELAKCTGGRVIPLAAQREAQVVRSEADLVGMVFPVYYGEVPVIVKEFAGKLEASGKYVFAVCNFGGAAGRSLKVLRGILNKRSVKLSAGFGVHMPQNAFLKPWEIKDKVYEQASRRIEFIAQKINARKKGTYYTNIPLEAFIRLLHPLVRRLTKKDFIKRTGADEAATIDQLIRMMGKAYSADENCTGCGTCAQVCPVGNILMQGGRPVWLQNCENCLACYDWCPSKAVTGGVANKGYRYRHPEVTAGEMKIREPYSML